MEFIGTLTSGDGKVTFRASGEWQVVGMDKCSGRVAADDGSDIALNATHLLAVDGGPSALIVVKTKSSTRPGENPFYFEGIGQDPPSINKSSTHC